jgi:hypothetical protein
MDQQRPAKRILNAKLEGEEDLNSGGKMEWIRMSKLWEKEIGRTYLGIEKSGRNFEGRLWHKKGCYANDDDDLLSKNIQFKIYKTVVLPVVLYGYETYETW